MNKPTGPKKLSKADRYLPESCLEDLKQSLECRYLKGELELPATPYRLPIHVENWLNERKPCPFCGGDGSPRVFSERGSEKGYFYCIQCEQCGSNGPIFQHMHKEEPEKHETFLWIIWNNRKIQRRKKS